MKLKTNDRRKVLYANAVSIVLGLCLISSCGMLQVGGLTSGYKHLTDGQKQRIKNYPTSSADIEKGCVYKVSASQIKDYIQMEKDVLVYDFTPWCSGDNCVNPILLDRYCRENGLTLCVIANAYDDLFAHDLRALQYYVIDEEACGTRRRGKYIRLFYDELTQVEEKIRGYGSFLLFQDGSFKQAFEDVNALKDCLQ